MAETDLYLVIPCYNEECVLETTADALKTLFQTRLAGTISERSRILFVDDGSTDRTWEIVCRLHGAEPLYEGIRLSRNRGHQIALFAGIMTAMRYADAIITIDSDLQQDINVIPEFLERYQEGCDIVYGVRNSRDTDGTFKRWSATAYYKIMRLLGGELVEQSADYRLMSKRAAEALAEYKENNLFIRGLVPTLGYKTGYVHFDVKERANGESKYTLKKMLQLAVDGITSFSIRPLRLIFFLGIIISIVSLIKIIHAVVEHYTGTPISGWASLTVSIWFLGGVNFIALGIIGEYIGRTYMETKHRPRFFISERLVHDTENEKQDKRGFD